MAADARRVIPHRPGAHRCPPEVAVAPIEIGTCHALIEAPVVLFGHDGYSTRGASGLGKAQLMAALSSSVELWKQLDPRRPFHGKLIGVARGETLARELLLADLHELGFRHMQLATRMLPERVPTATVGTFDLRPTCCAIDLELDANGVRLAAEATYEDLLRAAHEAKRRGTVLRIAPWR